MEAIYLHKSWLFAYIMFSYWIGLMLSVVYKLESLKFVWYDIWIGFYYDKENKVLYYNPLPCIVFKYNLP